VSKWYHWRHGRTTVYWPIRIFWWRAVGLIRVHYDKDKIPGDYHCVGTIIVKNRKYEVMGFMSRDREPGTAEEFKAFYDYLRSLGLKRKRHVRAKDGKVNSVETA
jgi:hypothetical protein